MGGTTHETAPAQAALLPELQVPVHPEVRPRLGVWGVLLEDARHYTSAGGAAHLQVVIAQHLPGRPEACPVMATYHYPDTGTPNLTAQVAHQAAAHLKRGVEVMVTGEGQYPSHHNGHPVMALHHVRSIRPVDHYLPHEPTEPRTTPTTRTGDH